MHRSGTSAFTRVLSLLGCDLPKTLMQAHKSNETGHWESDVIRHLNDRILASAGTRWDDWLEVNPGWLQSPKSEEFREEALALLREEFGASRLFVLKDPRICRLLPFWLSVLDEAGVRPLILSPVRNPLEVAASLGGRNGFEAGLGHLLWLRHVLDSEFGSRGTPRFFTSYDRLIGGWARTATDAQTALGIAWPRMSDRAAGEIEGFLSDHHRHYQEPEEAVLDNPTLSDWLRGTFEILGRWATAGESPQDFAALDRIRAELNIAAPAFSRLLGAEQGKARRLEKELAAAKAADQEKLTRLEVELAAAKVAEREKAKRLETELTAAKAAEREKASRLETELAAAKTAERETASRLEGDLRLERQKLGETQQQIARLKNDLETRTVAAEEAGKALSELRHRLEQTESALAQRRHETEQTAAELAATREEHRKAAGARAEAEKVSAGLKEHIVLLMADVKERQAALAEMQQARAAESAESNAAVAAVARQVKQVLAVLETSRSEIATRLGDAEKARARQSLELEARLGQQADEIEALRRQVEETRGEARHERSEAERLRQVAASEIGRAAGLLNGHGSPSLWRPFRLRRHIAHLKSSGMFDAEWYLREYTDVASAGIDPLRHYVEFGAKEGRAPNPSLTRPNGHAKGEAAEPPGARLAEAPEGTGEVR